MKRIHFVSLGLALALGLIVAQPAAAQMHTLMHGDTRHGGYGGPTVFATWFDGEPGVMVGGHGAWLINGSFAIGGGGAGLATMHRISGTGAPRHTLEGGYGGLILEYVDHPNNLVHLQGGALIGAGGMSIMEGPRASTSRDSIDETAFFVTRPYVGASLNVTEFFQLYVSSAYRFVLGSTLEGYGDAALSGAEFGLGFRFGSF